MTWSFFREWRLGALYILYLTVWSVAGIFLLFGGIVTGKFERVLYTFFVDSSLQGIQHNYLVVVLRY